MALILRRILWSLLLFGNLVHSLPLDKDTALVGGDDELRDALFEPPSLSKPKEVKNDANSNSSHNLLGQLPLPKDYNKLVIPLGKVNSSIFVQIQLGIREILDVDTKGETVELDTEIGVSWIDWEIWKYFQEDKEIREQLKNGPEEIFLNAEFLRQIWRPDIYIDELASVDRTSLLSKLVNVKYLVRNAALAGTINFKSRQSLKLRCDMNFQYYPADTQKCVYNIRSYAYPVDQLFLMWEALRSVCLDKLEDSNFDFQVSNVEPGGKYEDMYMTSQIKQFKTNHSVLSFTLEIRRNVTYYLVQTYLPAVLLMLITWLCFLLPVEMVEARIGISMTTLLTLTAMFSAVREQAPDVSYSMAIDIWMVFCIFLVFVALVLFTVVYWMRQQLEKYQNKHAAKEQTQNDNSPNQNGGANSPSRLQSDDEEFYIQIVENSRKYAFWLFALIFIVFLVTYTTWLAICSDYYQWEPSETWNAIENPDDDSNRLFAFKKKEFEKDDTFKITASEWKYEDIVDTIIKPSLTSEEV